MDTDTLIRPGALHLGLGCSRLGSVSGASKDEARDLLQAALTEGFRVFDTSNIYGQGDSERLIGEAIAGYDDCVVISKAGKYVVWQRRALLPLKGVIRSTIRRSAGTRQRVSETRSKPMPTRWDARYLAKSVEGSLRRLRRERVEIFMLHSPGVDVIRAGEAVGALDTARSAGKIGQVGVSVDDVETALAALTDSRVSALQLPLHPGSSEYDDVVDRANKAGVAVIAREVLGGIGGLSSHEDPSSFARQRIAEVVQDPRITLPLVGATRMTSLTASASAARGACAEGL